MKRGPMGRPADAADDELTVIEVAELLCVHEGTVLRWARLGRLPSRLVARPDGQGRGMRLIRRSDIEAFNASQPHLTEVPEEVASQ